MLRNPSEVSQGLQNSLKVDTLIMMKPKLMQFVSFFKASKISDLQLFCFKLKGNKKNHLDKS